MMIRSRMTMIPWLLWWSCSRIYAMDHMFPLERPITPDPRFGEKRVSMYRMMTAYLVSNGWHEELPTRDQHRIAVNLKRDALTFLGGDDELFTSGDFDRLFAKARQVAVVAPAAVDVDENKYADRYVQYALQALEDYDCMEREFDVTSEDFDADDASFVLKKASHQGGPKWYYYCFSSCSRLLI